MGSLKASVNMLRAINYEGNFDLPDSAISKKIFDCVKANKLGELAGILNDNPNYLNIIDKVNLQRN